MSFRSIYLYPLIDAGEVRVFWVKFQFYKPRDKIKFPIQVMEFRSLFYLTSMVINSMFPCQWGSKSQVLVVKGHLLVNFIHKSIWSDFVSWWKGKYHTDAMGIPFKPPDPVYYLNFWV